MRGPRSWGIVIFLLMGPSALPAQNDVRTAARQVAELAVADGGFAAGTSVRLTVEAGDDADILREGLIEGLLNAGLVVLDEGGGREPSLELAFVSRGQDAKTLRVSVVGSLPDEGRYVFSRGYVIPHEERSFLDEYLAPVIVVSAAVLAVYLLLTVRSS